MKSTIKQLFSLFLFIVSGTTVNAQYQTLWGNGITGNGEIIPIETIIDPSGNVVTAGFVIGTADLDPGSGTQVVMTGTEINLYIQKLDTDGNFLWAKTVDTNIDFISSKFGLDSDNSGNIYLTGEFKGNTDFDPGLGVSNLTMISNTRDAFVLKLQSNGNFSWVKRIGKAGSYGCLGHKLTIDSSGDIIIGGNFRGTIDFDPGSSVYDMTSASLSGYIQKLDANGNFIWAKLNALTTINTMTTDNSGNILLGGYFNGTVDFNASSAVFLLSGTNDGYVQKLNSVGDFIWAFSFGEVGFDVVNKIKIDTGGNIYATGSFSGSIDIDPGIQTYPLTSTATQDLFVAKFTSAGSFVWGRQALSAVPAHSVGNSIAIDNAGNIYCIGNFIISTDFNPQSSQVVITTPSAQNDAFIMKIDNTGSFSSICTFGGTGNDIAYDIAINDLSGRIHISGTFENTIDLDLGTGTDIITQPGSERAGFIITLIPCITTQNTLTITACDNYTLNGETYTSSGTYVQSLTNAAGCDSIITINLTISDGIAPVADLASLANVTNQCSVASLTAPTATDNCAGTINGTTTTTFPITIPGTTVVTWTYADGNGNTSTQTQNVIIADNTAPVANTASLADVTEQCSVASLTAPTATDNCAGTITGTTTTTLPITTPGTTVVTWTYADGNGNTSTQTQNVVIADDTAPVADLGSLADVTNQCSVASLTAPTATDNCAGVITATTTTTFPINASGTTVVTWTYDDGNGNTSTQTQNVIIADNTAPVANTASLAVVTNQCSVASLTAPTATDNCSGVITGTTTTTFPITIPGTTVVTWTYDDGNGNTATQTQNVIITLPSASTTLSGLTISATTSGAAYQWINCGTGNTPIAGATAQSFTATANGTYAVIVTQNGCSATSSCVTISTVDLKEQDKLAYAVYPNPNNGRFTLSATSPLQITITNTAGQIVLKNQIEPGQHDLELPDVESGIYFIHASNETNQIATIRICVLR